MDLEDLEYIFESQRTEGTIMVYFMVEDAEVSTVIRHDISDLASLLPMLDSLEYQGQRAGIPRFAADSDLPLETG